MTITHIRYYIKLEHPNGLTMYREQTGGWVSELEHANLWANKDFVNKKLKELDKQENYDYARVGNGKTKAKLVKKPAAELAKLTIGKVIVGLVQTN